MYNPNMNDLIKSMATVREQLDEHILATRQLRDEAAAIGEHDRILYMEGALNALLAFRADWDTGFTAAREEVST